MLMAVLKFMCPVTGHHVISTDDREIIGPNDYKGCQPACLLSKTLAAEAATSRRSCREPLIRSYGNFRD
jgi:hypothetical protein